MIQKSLLALLLTAALSAPLLLSSCGSPADDPSAGQTTARGTEATETDNMEEPMNRPIRYDPETFMQPFWKGDTVYHEAVTVIRTRDGKAEAPLFYKSGVKILDVYDMTLCTRYVEGVDYYYEDGMLKLTENTRCPFYEEEEYYPRAAGDSAFVMNDGVHHTVYEALNDMGGKQLAVTYTHTDRYDGYRPSCKAELLPQTIAKLESKQPLKIVFYGDSITVGYGSSGMIPSPPSLPDYPTLFSGMLIREYRAPVTWVNTAVGGTGIEWGIQNVNERVIAEQPDLVVLAFGMNDGGVSDAAYWTARLKLLIDKIRTALPSCEFLLVSTMWANPEAKGWNKMQPSFEKEMLKLESEGIAVAQVTSLHESIMQGKTRAGVTGEPILGYVDTTGNNVNHPNDFFTRLYAQTLFAAVAEGYS